MIEVTCKNCLKKWYVLDNEWMEVESCPFCSILIEKKYEISINSFDDALKQIFLTQGYDVLKEKRRLIAFFMDVYTQYKQEMKIVENFCAEDRLKRIYEYKDDILSLERETKMMESDMIDNGIAEKWAERISKSFLYAIKDTENPVLCLPNNFCVISKYTDIFPLEENMEIVDENLKEQNSEKKRIESVEKICEKQNKISNEKICELVHKFISKDRTIGKEKGDFQTKSIKNLKRVLGVPVDAVIFLIHYDSVYEGATDGYVITNMGIFSSALGKSKKYVSWEEFMYGTLSKIGNCFVKLNGESLIFHTIINNRMYMVNEFFFELQKYIKQNMGII